MSEERAGGAPRDGDDGAGRDADRPGPSRPRKPVAPETHPLEARRLAQQELAWPDADPLVVQTLLWLLRAGDAAMDALTDSVREADLTPSSFNILMALANTPGERLEPWQLAERLVISRPSVTGILDGLESRGLLRREPHPTDGRRLLVRLEPAAHELLDRTYPAHYAHLERLVADLSDDERALLVTLLRRVDGAVPAHLADDDPRVDRPPADEA